MTRGLVALIAVCAIQAQTTGYSEAKEAAIGTVMAKEHLRSHPLIDLPAVQQYVEQVATRLTAQIPGDRAFRVAVTADYPCRSACEPTGLPGGYVFVPAGVLLQPQDEAEFAAMLGHAMLHVAPRHHLRPARSGQIPLVYVHFDGESLLPPGLRKVAAALEQDADAMAVRLLSDANYHPSALLRFVERQTVPAERLDALQRLVGAGGLPSPTREFSAMQNELRAAVVGPARVPSLRRPSLRH